MFEQAQRWADDLSMHGPLAWQITHELGESTGYPSESGVIS
jgi:hypothetical protein